MLVVLDTNVLVAALRSPRGASRAVLELVLDGELRIGLSTAVLLEYEDVLARPGIVPDDAIVEGARWLRELARIARRQTIHFRWRPTLPDAADDKFVELALHCRADAIVTHNLRHFLPARALGLDVMLPSQILPQTPRLP